MPFKKYISHMVTAFQAYPYGLIVLYAIATLTNPIWLAIILRY